MGKKNVMSLYWLPDRKNVMDCNMTASLVKQAYSLKFGADKEKLAKLQICCQNTTKGMQRSKERQINSLVGPFCRYIEPGISVSIKKLQVHNDENSIGNILL